MIPVVAVVASHAGQYLVGRRPYEKQHGGLWEFPGGKVDPGETLLEAAHREVAEELAMEVTSVGETLFVGRDSGSPFEIHFVEVTLSGEPVALEHIELGWFTPKTLRAMPLAPSDAAFVEWVAATT